MRKEKAQKPSKHLLLSYGTYGIRTHGLRFAPVGAKRTFPGCPAVFASLRSALNGRPPDVQRPPPCHLDCFQKIQERSGLAASFFSTQSATQSNLSYCFQGLSGHSSSHLVKVKTCSFSLSPVTSAGQMVNPYIMFPSVATGILIGSVESKPSVSPVGVL